MQTEIYINELFNSKQVLSTKDAPLLVALVKDVLKHEGTILLNFENVDVLTTGFLRNSIKKLYDLLDRDMLDKRLQVKTESLSPSQQSKIDFMRHKDEKALTEKEIYAIMYL